MTLLSRPSNRTPAHCSRLALALVAAIALLLCLPATGFAGERAAQTERGESFATALSSAGLLARGAGYASPGGSELVRGLQGRLSKLGHQPGPIDGLLGPLTEGAILRFQQARGLVVDGVVGPQTKASLVGRRAERPNRTSKPRAERRPADTTEPMPAPGPRPSANPSPSIQSPPSTAPKPSAAGEPSEGIAPAYVALLGALAAGLLLSALWAATGRRTSRASRERPAASPSAGAARLNVGVACAALLGVFAAGAAGGAAFATRAAPDAVDSIAPDRGRATVEPPAAGSGGAARPPRSERPRTRHGDSAPSRSTSPSRTSRPATETAQAPEAGTPAAPRRAAQPPDSPPPRPKAYTVQRGDSLWPIAAEQPPPTTSVQAVARRVARIKALNSERFTSSDPNVLVAGEQLRLR